MTQIILSVKYDWRLVVLSIAIAVYASYIGFDFVERAAAGVSGVRQLRWLAASAAAMGLGVWSTQCIGMMALVFPVAVRYDVPIMAAGLAVAIVSSGLALFVISRKDSGDAAVAGGSFALGGGIAALHYLGMAGMQFAASRVYNLAFVGLSVMVAMAGSGGALQLARWGRGGVQPLWIRLACALAVGFTIGVTHYTGMAAVTFRYNQALAAGNHAVSGTGLSIAGITLLTLAVVGLSLLGSRVEHKFALQRRMLLSEQERWLLVASESPDGLFDIDLVTGQAFYSARWKAMIGYDPDELDATMETWRQTLHPADRQKAEDQLQRYLQGGQGAFEMEYRVCHRDGGLRWILARAQAIWDGHRKPVRLVGSHSDISARKLHEEQLLLSESRYRGLFEANPMPSWIYSPQDLTIQDANQAARDYFGWSREQFVGKSIRSIRMPGEEEGGEGSGQKAPWRLRRKDRSGIWVELANYEIESGGSPASLLVANDVTSHVVNEAKIQRAKGQLEGIVAQKTVKLQNSEAQWNSLAENLPQLVWSARPDGSCDYSNHQWSEFTGVSRDDLAGFGWLDTIHPDDRGEVEKSWRHAVELGERCRLEYRIRKSDGTYRKFAAQIVPVRSEEGKPIEQWVGTSTELESQAQSEEDSLVGV